MTLFSLSSETGPVHSLQRLQRELERVFDNPFGLDLGPSGRGVFPPANVFSDTDGTVVRIEVPGVAPQDLSIEAQDRTLVIRGKREPLSPEKGSFHRRERWSGEFSRSIQLPRDLDLGKAEASCKDGMLTVKVPKRAEARPRQIAIDVA